MLLLQLLTWLLQLMLQLTPLLQLLLTKIYTRPLAVCVQTKPAPVAGFCFPGWCSLNKKGAIQKMTPIAGKGLPCYSIIITIFTGGLSAA